MAIYLQEGGKRAAPGCGAVLSDFFGHKQCRGHAACRQTRGSFGECQVLSHILNDYMSIFDHVIYWKYVIYLSTISFDLE